MRKRIVYICLIIVVALAINLGLRIARVAQIHRAAAALGTFGVIIIEYSKEMRAPLPVTLDEIPEWQKFADDPRFKGYKDLFQQIHYYYPLENRNDDARVATIELKHSRLVLKPDGSVVGEEK